MAARATPSICIVTPATRNANNGNWRTAARWYEMLRDRYRVIVQSAWGGEAADALIALHAHRSAPSIAAFAQRMPGRPIAVVLTGTDLYRDLPGSQAAAASLDAASEIVTLQGDAPRLLQPRWRAKTRVIFQSAASLRPRRKPEGRLDCVAVGHLRPEKDPLTLLAAMRRIPPSLPIRMRHIGDALDPALGDAVREYAREDGRYRYMGALPRGLTRAAMRAAHLLVHPSVMEGGANVIVEAVTAGTAVVASRISGNLGMLGEDYPGYFPSGDAAALADSLVRALEEPAYRKRLEKACAARKALFRPEAEARALRELAADLLGARTR